MPPGAARGMGLADQQDGQAEAPPSLLPRSLPEAHLLQAGGGGPARADSGFRMRKAVVRTPQSPPAPPSGIKLPFRSPWVRPLSPALQQVQSSGGKGLAAPTQDKAPGPVGEAEGLGRDVQGQLLGAGTRPTPGDLGPGAPMPPGSCGRTFHPLVW